LIQKDVNSANIYKKCSTILNDKANYDSIKLRLGKLKDKLGGIGASRKTALLIYKLLNEA
jgi:lipid A disaccharide synthetase